MTTHHLILCYGCAAKIDPDDIAAILQAKWGPMDVDTEDQHDVLMCPAWLDRRAGIPASAYLCDHCGITVAVANSSRWFIERYVKERG